MGTFPRITVWPRVSGTEVRTRSRPTLRCLDRGPNGDTLVRPGYRGVISGQECLGRRFDLGSLVRMSGSGHMVLSSSSGRRSGTVYRSGLRHLNDWSLLETVCFGQIFMTWFKDEVYLSLVTYRCSKLLLVPCYCGGYLVLFRGHSLGFLYI